MTGAVWAIVVAGVAAAVLAGSTQGFDAVAVVLLGVVVALGVVAVVISRKAGTGSVAPLECPECGGLVSPHAPYCKHCGAGLSGSS
ncbi:MAG: hypothetical protein M3280_02075 [Actinomycetota bacterium]|nr:hypothetical protein [Actinomycetota bacterium]